MFVTTTKDQRRVLLASKLLGKNYFISGEISEILSLNKRNVMSETGTDRSIIRM